MSIKTPIKTTNLDDVGAIGDAKEGKKEEKVTVQITDASGNVKKTTTPSSVKQRASVPPSKGIPPR